jgi:predicted MFS family arabinose efflux permease
VLSGLEPPRLQRMTVARCRSAGRGPLCLSRPGTNGSQGRGRVKSAVTTDTRATFRDVFGIAEFRALWLAQVLSVSGDQLARVALTVLVYDRTRSALLAAVAFAASVVPTFIGGLALSGLADRLPRRRVMIGADLASGVLVAAMVLPGVPLVALIMLLFAVTMVGALFLAARAATYPEILDGDRYVVGTAVTMSTVLFAQVAGFAVGGIVVGFLGVRVSLLADAATFGASALITRVWVRARPVPTAPSSSSPRHLGGARGRRGGRRARPPRLAGVVAGLRLVFGSRAMRTPMLFGWLCAFYELPQGVAIPLATAAGGGAVTVGLILAAQAVGSAAGVVGFSRLACAAQRAKWTGPLAAAACASLVLFAAGPALPAALLILAVSGLFGCYQIAANASFVQATPAAQRSQAFGIAQGGISLAQGTAIVLAGAAAQHAAPASVIAAAGGIGALCALALTLTAGKAERHPAAHRRRWGRSAGLVAGTQRRRH